MIYSQLGFSICDYLRNTGGSMSILAASAGISEAPFAAVLPYCCGLRRHRSLQLRAGYPFNRFLRKAEYALEPYYLFLLIETGTLRLSVLQTSEVYKKHEMRT